MDRPKKPNWDKIRIAYEAGEGSYQKLAARFKVSSKTLEGRACREKWSKGKAVVREKVRVKVHDAIAEKVAKTVLSDIEYIDAALVSLFDKLKDSEAKSLEGVANAIARLVQVKNEIANPDKEDAVEGFEWKRIVPANADRSDRLPATSD